MSNEFSPFMDQGLTDLLAGSGIDLEELNLNGFDHKELLSSLHEEETDEEEVVEDEEELYEDGEEYDSGFYRNLIEDELQNRKFAKIRDSLKLGIQCTAKQAVDEIEEYIETQYSFHAPQDNRQAIYEILLKMGTMVFELTEKGEVEFLGKTWERRGGVSYEDEEEDKKISLLTLQLGGEENANFVKKTRSITKKYMARAMKQALEQLIKDFDLNEIE